MTTQTSSVVPLADLEPGQEADFFALLSAREELTTRDGKPYFRVTFRDARREVSFPIWNDAPFAEECRKSWAPGTFFKLRATFRETNYGPQLDIRKIRAVDDSDRAEGFDPAMCRPQSRFDAKEMFDELVALAGDEIGELALAELVVDILQANREALLTLPAASRNHHAYAGGFLEHVRSVVRSSIYLADKYHDYYPDLDPPLARDLVVAGAILHDIGKLRELEERPEGAIYSPAGQMIGHVLQGRDIVREAAARHDVSPETLLRLEHVIVSHQRLPEWGSPKPPMTPEALIVHYADDLDAKYQMMYLALRDDPHQGPFTSQRNPLQNAVYRGEADAEA